MFFATGNQQPETSNQLTIMLTEADYYALFEAYSTGELAAPARADFEARLSADPALALRFADFTELTDTMRAYGQRQRARQQLRGIHAAMLAAETAEQPAALTHTVHPILRISRTERRLRRFWSGHRATVGVAASVAVMAVFATLLGLDLWRNAKSQPGYQALRSWKSTKSSATSGPCPPSSRRAHLARRWPSPASSAARASP